MADVPIDPDLFFADVLEAAEMVDDGSDPDSMADVFGNLEMAVLAGRDDLIREVIGRADSEEMRRTIQGALERVTDFRLVRMHARSGAIGTARMIAVPLVIPGLDESADIELAGVDGMEAAFAKSALTEVASIDTVRIAPTLFHRSRIPELPSMVSVLAEALVSNARRGRFLINLDDAGLLTVPDESRTYLPELRYAIGIAAAPGDGVPLSFGEPGAVPEKVVEGCLASFSREFMSGASGGMPLDGAVTGDPNSFSSAIPDGVAFAIAIRLFRAAEGELSKAREPWECRIVTIDSDLLGWLGEVRMDVRTESGSLVHSVSDRVPANWTDPKRILPWAMSFARALGADGIASRIGGGSGSVYWFAEEEDGEASTLH